MIRKTLLFSFSLLVIPVLGREPMAEDSPRQFVQDFYSWYVPIAMKDHKVPAFVVAIKEKPSLFSPQLLKALQNDADAQAKASGEIVGIDWDPFLNTQDPSRQFEIVQIMHKENGYW